MQLFGERLSQGIKLTTLTPAPLRVQTVLEQQKGHELLLYDAFPTSCGWMEGCLAGRGTNISHTKTIFCAPGAT